MTAAVLDSCPNVSTELVELWTLIAFGSPTTTKKRLGVIPRIQDRLAAARELADRLHGRAIQASDADHEQPMVPVFLLPEGARVATK